MTENSSRRVIWTRAALGYLCLLAMFSFFLVCVHSSLQEKRYRYLMAELLGEKLQRQREVSIARARVEYLRRLERLDALCREGQLALGPPQLPVLVLSQGLERFGSSTSHSQERTSPGRPAPVGNIAFPNEVRGKASVSKPSKLTVLKIGGDSEWVYEPDKLSPLCISPGLLSFAEKSVRWRSSGAGISVDWYQHWVAPTSSRWDRQDESVSKPSSMGADDVGAPTRGRPGDSLRGRHRGLPLRRGDTSAVLRQSRDACPTHCRSARECPNSRPCKSWVKLSNLGGEKISASFPAFETISKASD